MYKPSIDELLELVGNRYTLSMIVSKRARQVIDGSKTSVEKKSEKTIDIAIDELNEGLLSYRRMTEEEIEIETKKAEEKEVSEDITDILSEYK